MKAAFRTLGSMMTHSDLSSRDCGISSGISRISLITVPEFSTRSTSFLLSAAGVVVTTSRPATSDTQSLFITRLLRSQIGWVGGLLLDAGQELQYIRFRRRWKGKLAACRRDLGVRPIV